MSPPFDDDIAAIATAPGESGLAVVRVSGAGALALADRVFALERGAVFHQGPAEPLLKDLDYRKKILWL